MKNKENTPNEESLNTESNENDTVIKAENTDNADENTEQKKEDPEAKTKELNDKYLRLYSEFDNYRKRTLKERSEIIKTAAEDVFKTILPIIDDLDRAVKANETVSDAEAIKEGMSHISNKLKNAVQQKGLTSFNSVGEAFNPDFMEAITHIPATDESQKGKVVDEVEKGYKLGDKVIRFAKVIIAQ